MIQQISIDDLPGEESAAQGLRDLANGVESVPSPLLEIASSRLRRGGLAVPEIRPNPIDAELRLYDLLEAQDAAGAYSEYSAWLNRLSRFCHAVEKRSFLLARESASS